MITENLKIKQSMIDTFAEPCSTFFLAAIPPVLLAMVGNTDLKTLAASETLAVASFAVGKIRNRNTSERDHPTPLAAENAPITIVNFKKANATS
jgi:hypothetical protein